MTGAANRDPRHYERPDAFDIDRNPRDHVAFGSGVHLCLGAPLARLEGKVLFETLIARTEGLQPAGLPVRNPNPLLRGMRSVPVKVTPAASVSGHGWPAPTTDDVR